jgi:hypothetical protein
MPVIMTLMLPFAPTPTSFPRSAQIWLAVTIAFALRARRIRTRITRLMRRVVNTAHFAALLAHPLIVHDIFRPPDSSALLWFCSQAESAAGRAGTGIGLQDCLAAVGGWLCCASRAPLL